MLADYASCRRHAADMLRAAMRYAMSGCHVTLMPVLLIRRHFSQYAVVTPFTRHTLTLRLFIFATMLMPHRPMRRFDAAAADATFSYASYITFRLRRCRCHAEHLPAARFISHAAADAAAQPQAALRAEEVL